MLNSEICQGNQFKEMLPRFSLHFKNCSASNEPKLDLAQILKTWSDYRGFFVAEIFGTAKYGFLTKICGKICGRKMEKPENGKVEVRCTF